ncbi:14937_t:CDS:2, partial [Racocetra fulgida]
LKTQLDSYIKQQCIRTYLRKKQFLNPEIINNTITNLDGDVNLSEEIKSFTMLLTILQEIRDLNNAKKIVNEENIVSELADEEI